MVSENVLKKELIKGIKKVIFNEKKTICKYIIF